MCGLLSVHFGALRTPALLVLKYPRSRFLRCHEQRLRELCSPAHRLTGSRAISEERFGHLPAGHPSPAGRQRDHSLSVNGAFVLKKELASRVFNHH